MRFYTIRLLLVLIGGWILLFSCNDPSLIGSDLVEDEQVEVDFSDTFTLSMTTEAGDSVRVFGPGIANLDNYLIGNFVDPVFGRTEAGVFFRVDGPGTNPGFNLAQRVDSIVLILPLDTANIYGSFFAPHDLALYRVTEDLDNSQTYYSNQTWDYDPAPIATSPGFVPGNLDSIAVIEPEGGGETTVRYTNQWRMRLDPAFTEAFFNSDTNTFKTDSAFWDSFKGFYLKSTNDAASLLSFRLFSSSARLSVYYHTTDTTFRRYSFPMDRVLVSNFKNDRSGSPVEQALQQPNIGDSLVFLQGTQGLRVKVNLPPKPTDNNYIISKAQLEMTVAVFPNDNIDLFTPVDQLIMLKNTNDTTRVFIDDIVFVINSTDFNFWFGGNPVEDKKADLYKYTFNISSHLSDVWNGNENQEIYLQVHERWQEPNRVVLYGPKHSVYPAKLKVYFTESTN